MKNRHNNNFNPVVDHYVFRFLYRYMRIIINRLRSLLAKYRERFWYRCYYDNCPQTVAEGLEERSYSFICNATVIIIIIGIIRVIITFLECDPFNTTPFS